MLNVIKYIGEMRSNLLRILFLIIKTIMMHCLVLEL